MKISHLLNLKLRDIVAFIGAGGKTTALFRLADELVESGYRVITTTTTRLAEDELQNVPHQLKNDDLDSLPALLNEYRHVFLYSHVDDHGKVIGIPSQIIESDFPPSGAWDFLLIEADGSRRLPFKAPFPHEPQIPTNTTVVIPIIGADIFGQIATPNTIYGLENITTHIRDITGETITPRLAASVMLHPQLGMKSIPPQSRIFPLINKVSGKRLAIAQDLADHLLRDDRIERVLLGAVQDNNPIIESRRRISAIILAGGESRRMGQPKLLMDWGDHSIIRQTATMVASIPFYEIIIVTGRHHQAIEDQLSNLPITLIHNPDYATGEMLSSLQVGLSALSESSEACIVILGDQPMLTEDIIKTILLAYHQGRGEIVAPFFEGKRGHPIIIGKQFWADIANLSAGSAPRAVIGANADSLYRVQMDSDIILRDIDTPDDYQRESTGGQGA